MHLYLSHRLCLILRWDQSIYHSYFILTLCSTLLHKNGWNVMRRHMASSKTTSPMPCWLKQDLTKLQRSFLMLSLKFIEQQVFWLHFMPSSNSLPPHGMELHPSPTTSPLSEHWKLSLPEWSSASIKESLLLSFWISFQRLWNGTPSHHP